MKKTLILLMTTVFLACQADQQKKVATKVNPVVENQGAMQTVAPRKATVVSRDSLRPQMRRSTYIQDKSRPKTKIASNFPYDIDLKTADGKIVKSNDVFEQGKPTVLLFWLTTCFPCSVEMAAIEQKYRDWQKEADFQLVALSTDFEKNYPKFVSRV
ncbi:MAG: redoxin domain-containing protein, partial [Bacteroidota bacterium]